MSVLSPGCSYHSEVWSKMDQADSLMWSRPDSSMALLREIDTLSLNGKEEKARYALLMSMALDKNYIDTTTFSVLQPAIDYYLKRVLRMTGCERIIIKLRSTLIWENWIAQWYHF